MWELGIGNRESDTLVGAGLGSPLTPIYDNVATKPAHWSPLTPIYSPTLLLLVAFINSREQDAPTTIEVNFKVPLIKGDLGGSTMYPIADLVWDILTD